MNPILDVLRAKPAHKDKTLGTALGAAAILIGYSDGAPDAVQIGAYIGASIIISASIVGRFALRKEVVSTAALVYADNAIHSGDLPGFDESQEGYDEDA